MITEINDLNSVLDKLEIDRVDRAVVPITNRHSREDTDRCSHQAKSLTVTICRATPFWPSRQTRMNRSSTANSTEKFRAFRAIASAGLIAGILDITSAFVLAGLKGVGPIRVLQGVAMGLLGQQALEGGLATAGLGLAIHFSIAFAAASVFYTASRRFTFLTQHAVSSGLLYGVAVYGFMYWIVVPLAFVNARHSVSRDVTAVIVHMLLIGLPISLIVRRCTRPLFAQHE